MKRILYPLTCTILVTLACGTSNLAPTLAPTLEPNTVTVGTSLPVTSQTQEASATQNTPLPTNTPLSTTTSHPTETNLPTDTQTPRDQQNFTTVGYFKDDTNNRIFTISYKLGTSEDEIRAHAEDLMYTPGQMMAAYFYPEESMIPADGVTLAGSVFEANDVLYETPGLSKWRYAYIRYLNGTSEFVDCEQDPDHDLCRKK